jgi:glyceraldehyde 3-phosphate dehydrogenase
MRVAINGMGRIGRLLFRRLYDHPGIELVAVNDIMDPLNLAYLLKYDSVYGTFPAPLSYTQPLLQAGNRTVKVFNNPHPAQLPWGELKVDVVLECSGHFTSTEAAGAHLEAGARRVMLSTTGTDDMPLLIYGFNQHALSKDTAIFSPGGCMTNCSTHILYIMQAIGIESAQVNFIHSYTSRQELVDAPHKDFRRGRAAAESVIPVPIDLAHSLQRLLPPLQDRIATLSIRVPVANGALADFNLQMRDEVTVAQVNEMFRKAAAGAYRGILDYTEDPIVSLDIKGNTHSAIIDGSLTSVVGRQVKVVAFFDNEYGYTSRMIDWLREWNSA